MKTIKSTFLTKTFSFNFHFKWVKTHNKTHRSVATLEIYSCMLKSFTSYSYLTHSCTQRTYNTTKRCAFDEYFVFAHILRWTALISWGTRHKCKPWRLSGALIATARAPECVLLVYFNFEDHQSRYNPWWSTVVEVIYHRWPMSSFCCELASQCKNQ